jgi:hypothetical protein
VQCAARHRSWRRSLGACRSRVNDRSSRRRRLRGSSRQLTHIGLRPYRGAASRKYPNRYCPTHGCTPHLCSLAFRARTTSDGPHATKVYECRLLRLIVSSRMDLHEMTSPPFYLEEISATTSDNTLANARTAARLWPLCHAQPGAARFCFGSLEIEADRLPISPNY